MRTAQETNVYDPRYDALYRYYLRFTIIGVAGGIIGIVILVRQTILLRRSVVATHRSADALMDSEAALLTLSDQTCDLISDGKKTFVTYQVRNVGRTSAIVFSAKALLQVSDNVANPPERSLYNDTERLPTEYYLPPGEIDRPKTFLSEVGEGSKPPGEPFSFSQLSKQELETIKAQSKTLWSYGFIRYRDVFKREFEFRFCHRYAPNLSPSPGFVLGGISEFNRLTRYRAGGPT